MKILSMMAAALSPWAFFAGMCLGGAAMLKTVGRYLPVRDTFWARPILFLLFFFAITMPTWIGDENPLFFFPFFVGAFLLCCEESRLARLSMGFVLYAALIPGDMFIDSLGYWGIAVYGDGLLGMGCKLLLWAGVWFLARRVMPRGPARLSQRMWVLIGGLSLAPVFAMLSFSLWGWGRRMTSGPYFDEIAKPIAYTILPFVLLSGLALLVAVAVLSRQETLEQERRLAQTREIYYQGLQREQQQVRTIRHDLRNHLTALQGLLEGAREEEALRYLQTLAQSPALTGGVRWCENETANAVLASKAADAKEKGLELDCKAALPADLPVTGPDLCALLGNALDNAIEGAVESANKQIYLRAGAEKGLLMLRVENAYAGERARQGDLFFTTKEEKQGHGLGLRGMREIAGRYGGSLEVTAQNGRFQLIACLPLIHGESPRQGGNFPGKSIL